MSQALDQLMAVRGLLNGFARNGTLSAQQVEAVEAVMGRDQSPTRTIGELTQLVQVNHQLVPQAARLAFEAIVGAAPAQPTDREVTITLRVSGNAQGVGGQATQAVEAALTGPAARAGLTITRGSVRITGM